jgi:hypothetical protein
MGNPEAIGVDPEAAFNPDSATLDLDDEQTVWSDEEEVDLSDLLILVLREPEAVEGRPTIESHLTKQSVDPTFPVTRNVISGLRWDDLHFRIKPIGIHHTITGR